MVRQIIFIISFLLVWGSVFGQDPQTNYPEAYYPLLDNYIKEGYQRNMNKHMDILGSIDYVYIYNISGYVTKRDYGYATYGTTDTYLVYRYYNSNYKDFRYSVAYNEVWVNNPTVFRRIFYKVMGIVNGLTECHKTCDHIMSGRPLMDNHLFFHDLVPEQWAAQLNYFFKELASKAK